MFEEMKSVYGDSSMSKTQIYEWHTKFKSGDRDLEDKPRSGRPSTLDDEEILSAVDVNPYLTEQELADDFGVAQSTISTHLKSLGFVKKLDRWIPHELTESNKSDRLVYCYELLRRMKRSGFWDSIVTSDEKWVLYDTPSHKRAWLQHGEIPRPAVKPSQHPRKVMLCCWWNSRGAIYWELMKPGQTITKEVYIRQLEEVRKALENQGVDQTKILYIQDNARPHIAKDTLIKIASNGWKLIKHAPYSPDLALSDYHLFRVMSACLRKESFKNSDEVEKWLSVFFTSHDATFYLYGMKKLRKRCQDVIDADGGYSVH